MVAHGVQVKGREGVWEVYCACELWNGIMQGAVVVFRSGELTVSNLVVGGFFFFFFIPLVGWHRHMGLCRDFGRQQGRPPAGPVPAALLLSHRPYAVMRGSLLFGAFLSFLL